MKLTTKLEDGRTFEYFDNGIESNQALVMHHGTTVSLEIFGAWIDKATEAGVRVVAPNRPGVGASTRKPGRRIIDDVNDVRELQAQLGITKFVAIGYSGGGARAMGSSMLQGCVSVHTAAGASPMGYEVLEQVMGFTPEQLEERRALLADFDSYLEYRKSLIGFDLAKNIKVEHIIDEIRALPNFAAFEADYLRFTQDVVDSIVIALEHGPEADGDDWYANITPWGFDLADVTAPVTQWHGNADTDVVLARGQYVHSQLPNSTLHVLDGIGHDSIMVEYRDQILDQAIAQLWG